MDYVKCFRVETSIKNHNKNKCKLKLTKILVKTKKYLINLLMRIKLLFHKYKN